MKPKHVAIVLALLAFVGAGVTLAQRGGQPAGVPDLVVSRMDFQKVQSGTDSQNHTYWIFNVIVYVKNQGAANAGPFKVLLERNNGGGGSFQVACQTCTLDVGGLAAGQETALPPRQFNNANAMPSQFRATADSGHAINEGNENNNSRTEGFVSMSVGDFGKEPIKAIKPDLVVTLDFQNIATYTAGGKTYASFTLAATVKNQGAGSAAASELQLERGQDPKILVTPVASPAVPALAPGAQVVITHPGAVYEFGSPDKYFKATIDPHNAVPETNDMNNYVVKLAPFAK